MAQREAFAREQQEARAQEARQLRSSGGGGLSFMDIAARLSADPTDLSFLR
jgi:hypothetical protein